ncbi:MAG TPA: mechanosensitive ion channel domain-containing protein [Candidatus Thermoplasmatota archaeon]
MRRAVAALLPLLAALLLAAAPAAAADPVQILAFGDYDRTLAPGESATFVWSVRNTDVIAYNVSVSVQLPAGFTATASTVLIPDLLPNRAAPITVEVRAPDAVAAATTAQVVLILTVHDGGAVVFIASSTATITIPSIYAEKRVLDVLDNPLPTPLDNEWGVFLLDVVIWLAIAFALHIFLDPFVKRLTLKTKTQLDDIVLRIVKTPLVILLFLYGTLQSLYALDRHVPAFVIDTLVVVYGLGSTLIFFYVGYRLFKDVGIHMARNVASRTHSNMDDVIIPIVEKLGLLVLGLAALGLLLGYLNVDLTLFVAGGIVTSMVIAFAAQDTLSNFFAGMFLLTDRPFKEGDEVYLADDMMVVRHIGMRTTRFYRYKDASIVTLPNNKLVNEQIVNFSNRKDPGLYMMTVGVGYGSDADQVKEILRSVIMRAPHVLKDNPDKRPVVRFKAMADSSINFFILVWIDERPNRFAVEDFLNTEIYKALNEAGVEIPFPQRTVHLLLEGLQQQAADGTLPPDVAELAERLRKVMPPPAPPRGAAEGAGRAGAAPAIVGGATSMGETTGPLGEEPVTGEETVGQAFDRIVGPAATVTKDADLHAAVQAILTTPSTRKVYVVDEMSRLLGVITIESLMKHLAHRLGAREGGVTSFMRFVRDMQTDSVGAFMREPVKVTRDTKIVDIARLVVDHHLNDFPVVDGEGRLEGEVNSLRLLQAALALFESRAGEGGGE